MPAEVAASVPVGPVAGAERRSRRCGWKVSRPRSRIASACWKNCFDLSENCATIERRSRALSGGPCAMPRRLPRAARVSDLCGVSPSANRGAELAATIAEQADAHMLFDWAGGLVWLTLAPRRRRRSTCRPRPRSHGRARHAHSRTSLHTRSVDVFSPAKRGAGRIDETGQGKLRPEGRIQPRSHVGGGMII